MLPGSTASTASPSRNRVDDTSFTSFCRFTQPSRDTITTLSSSTMKSSAVYSASPSSLAIVERRASPYFFWISSISTLTMSQRLCSSLSSVVDLARAPPLLLELLPDDQDLESRQAVDLQLENRVGLLGVEVEALDDLRGRVLLAFRLAHDLQDLVERVEDLLEALEDVHPLLQRAAARARAVW